MPTLKWAYFEDIFYVERLVALLKLVYAGRSRRSISGDVCQEMLNAGAAIMGRRPGIAKLSKASIERAG